MRVIQLGIHELLKSRDQFSKARAGLVAHAASYAEYQGKFQHSIHLIQAYTDIHLIRLFAPEHGLYGQGAAGQAIADSLDKQSGLPVISLYGERKAPDLDQLNDLDILLFDLQDAGVRCFTYLSTLKACLECCAQAKTRLIVLDRPNPLGRKVFGKGVKAGFESFVSPLDIPFVHGKTFAELAKDMAKHLGLEAWLECFHVENWWDELWPETGLPWFQPSPNLRSFQAAYLYPASVFLEGTNLSEGRGTDLPFEQMGAPFLDGYALANSLSDLRGVHAEVISFMPVSSKYAGETCQGIRLHIDDAKLFDPLQVARRLLREVAEQVPDKLEFLVGKDGRYFMDLLYGSDELRQSVLRAV